MTSTPNEADIILNRTNVALARSQRLIQSWLPAPSATASSAVDPEPDFDEDNEDVLHDLAGLGSKRKANDEGLPDGAFKRNKLSSNDKLLEQLLGKKVAQDRRKRIDLQKREAGRGKQDDALPKKESEPGLNGRKRRAGTVDDDDDEDESRAGSFKSRRKDVGRPTHVPKPLESEHERHVEDDNEAMVSLAEATGGNDNDSGEVVTRKLQPEAAQPARKKGGSYLDELLAQKAAKKSKKKKKMDKSNPEGSTIHA